MIVTQREREREREREAETQAEGEAGRGRSRLYAPGAWRGIPSRVSRITPWAKGRRQTAVPSRDPLLLISNGLVLEQCFVFCCFVPLKHWRVFLQAMHRKRRYRQRQKRIKVSFRVKKPITHTPLSTWVRPEKICIEEIRYRRATPTSSAFSPQAPVF